jgi:hypothetical protein
MVIKSMKTVIGRFSQTCAESHFLRKSQVKSPKSQSHDFGFFEKNGKSQSHDFDFF